MARFQNLRVAGVLKAGTAHITEIYVGGDPELETGTLMSGSEITVLDSVTAGTVTASKAVVVGTNKNIDTLVIADGGLYLGAGAGTAVTATAAELNLLDTSVAGTAVASKALVLGANKNIDTIVIADGGLYLGAGAGTAVTATAAEINVLDAVTAGAVTASKALVVDASKMLSSAAAISTGVMQIQMTSAGTGAARAFKTRAFSPAGAVTHGDLIGCYNLAETQGGGSISAANTTIAGNLSWTTAAAGDTIGSGNVVTCYRAIFDNHLDLLAGAVSAPFYANIWASTTGKTTAGVLIVNASTAGPPSVGAILTAASLSGSCAFDNAFDLSSAVFTTRFMRIPDDDKCADSDASCDNVASDAAIKIQIGSTDYYIPAFTAGNTTGSW